MLLRVRVLHWSSPETGSERCQVGFGVCLNAGLELPRSCAQLTEGVNKSAAQAPVEAAVELSLPLHLNIQNNYCRKIEY